MSDIVERFRSSSLDRLARAERMWMKLTQGIGDESAAADMRREVHTIKGDARLLEFSQVMLLAEKLEELFELGDEMGYAVPDELDLVVTMAVQFASMLLRSKDGAAIGGIDLDGFVDQVDHVVRETRARAERASVSRPIPIARRGPNRSIDRLSVETRARLARVATLAFVEYVNAVGTARERLRELWRSLSEEIRRLEEVPLAPLLERHVSGARDLAASLGKRVFLTLDIGQVAVEAAAADAVDLGVMHMVRNAVDHGIEPPEERRKAGKREDGAIHVTAGIEDDSLVVEVHDDGSGIDLAAIRARALKSGLLEEGDDPDDEEILGLIFQHGFTTRDVVTDVSGRGVGLDAVKTELGRLGGGASLRPRPSGGTTARIWVPATVRVIGVHSFQPGGHAVRLAVEGRWTPLEHASSGAQTLDIDKILGLRRGAKQTGVACAVGGESRIAFRSGPHRVAFHAVSSLEAARAHRICPTDDVLEVVSIGGEEALLVRPERVLRGAAR